MVYKAILASQVLLGHRVPLERMETRVKRGGRARRAAKEIKETLVPLGQSAYKAPLVIQDKRARMGSPAGVVSKGCSGRREMKVNAASQG